jgi:integrase
MIKMGSIKNLGKGKFGLFAEAGKNPGTGKRHRIYRTFHGNITGARKELARLETELAQGIFQESTKITVAQYLRWWLEQHSTGKGLAPKTAENYKFLIEKHLIKSLGALKLEELTTMHIQAAYVTPAIKKQLSPRTIEYAVKLLRTALKHAVKKYKFIKENPAEMVETPTKHKRQIRVLTGEEMSKFLAAAKDLREYPIILTALYTGMRRGEILGLRWCDIDFDKATATVSQTVQRIIGKGLVFKDCPKTESGFRAIDLPASVLNALRQAKRKQAEMKLCLGPDYQDRNLVFCLPDGRPLSPDGVSRRFHEYAVAAGFPDVRFHDTRHYENQKIMGNAC